ncbi:MAG: hypothetical protein ACKVRN_02375 [Pyrinomonadaceae bacterium]
MSTKRSSTWKFVLVPTLTVLFLAIYPQLNIWSVQGTEWHGAYVVSNYDEVAYSAYVNSLIDGKSRRNDPFIGKADLPYESLYSIQMIPAYSIAVPARVLGFSASTAFIILNFLIPIFSCLTIFAFVWAVTKDAMLSSVGVVAVLCLGTAVAFQGELQHIIRGNYLCDFFPFLRRYQPGFAFPLFFLFCLFIWRSFTAEENKRGLIFAVLSGLAIIALVFSYFFLWTTAIAWLGVLAFLWFVFKKEDRSKILVRAGIVGFMAISAIVPYFLMLTNRNLNTDDIQLLNYTRAPNLLVLPVVLGFLIIAGILYFLRNGRMTSNSPAVLLTASLALTPVVLFNQQIVSGRSLQPVHYEIFIANYLLLIAIVFFAHLIRKSSNSERVTLNFRRGLIYFGIAAAFWGLIESSATAKRNAGFEKLRDDAIPALSYLRDKAVPRAQNGDAPTIMTTNLMVADYIPTVTPYRPLWNPHTNSAGGVNHAENLELFYKYLYYSGYDEKDLAQAINENLFEVMAALFGGGRALPTLTGEAKPVTRSEIETEINKYRNYRNNFDQAKAGMPELSHIVVPSKAEPDFANLDRWYERDTGVEAGLFKVYNLKLRP